MTVPPPAPGSVATPSVEEHLAAVLETMGSLETLPVSLADAHGCRLAEDVVARSGLPGADTALLDGYAVRAADVAAATPTSPVSLLVVGDAHAGAAALALSVQAGCAVRVSAGASLPPGTDLLVPVPWSDGGLARVSVLQAPPVGGWIRRAGSDVAGGSVVLPRGTLLGPAQVGLLAAVGRGQVVVQPRPRVVVLSTARGLVEVGAPVAPGEVVDANSHLLAAACREAGAQPYRVGVAPDSPRELLDALEDHLIRADVLLASGGARGAQPGGGGDVVAEVLARLGTVSTARVALHPGGTFALGRVGPDEVPYLGLPGHPASAFVAFELFVRPALRRVLGVAEPMRPRVPARLAGPVSSAVGLRGYVPVSMVQAGGQWVATPLLAPGLHPLGALGMAAGLAVVPEAAATLKEGAKVEVVLLERRQG